MIPVDFSPSLADPAPDFIPDHCLIRPIGEGSYGKVWLGRNAVGEFRAIKIVFRSRFRSERPFERELAGILTFEPISRLHPGFVDVLHVGCRRAEACFYYCMELADNLNGPGLPFDVDFVPKTLESLIMPGKAMPVALCLEYALGLADGLAFLHEQGLVHRDIKPSNVIFVGGIAKFADIGLVADMEETRSFVGTEGFVPPEGPGTTQADIYSFGKLLYEMCSGRDRKEFPAIPGSLDDMEEYLELNEVLLRACHPDIGRRYESARQMHADLKLIDDGKSVRRVRRLERQVGRLEKAAQFMVCLAVLSLVAGYAAGWTRRAADALRRERIGFLTVRGLSSLERGDVAGAIPGLLSAAELETSPGLSAQAWNRLGDILERGPRLIAARVLWPLPQSVAFDAAGKRLIVAGPEVSPEVFDADLKPGRPRIIATMFTGLVAVDPVGRFIATGNAAGSIRLLSAPDLKGIWATEMRAEIYGLQFDSSGTLLAVACSNQCVRVWDVVQHREILRIPHPAAVMDVHFNSAGEKLVTSCRDGYARVWTLTGQRVGQPLAHSNWVYSAVFSPDDSLIATASYDRQVRLWNANSGEPVGRAGEHLDGVRTVEFSPDGSRLVSAGFDSTVRVWRVDPHSGLSAQAILSHTAKVTSAALSRNGRRVASVAADGSLRLWDLNADGRPFDRVEPLTSLFSLKGSEGATNLYFPCDLTQGLGPLASGQIALFSKVAPVPLPTRIASDLNATTVCRARPWTASWRGGSVVFYDALSGSSRLFDMSEPVEECTFSHDGAYLFVVGKSSVACLVVKSWVEAFPRISFDRCAYRVVVNRDESMFAVCCQDSTLSPFAAHIFTRDGHPVGRPLQHRDGVLGGDFSPDSRRFVTAGEDFSAVIWDVATGRQIGETLTHHHQVGTALFSQDGASVLTATEGGEVCLWDSTSGLPLQLPMTLDRPVVRAYFFGERIVLWDDRGQYWISRAVAKPSRGVAGEWCRLQFASVLPENFDKRMEMLRPHISLEDSGSASAEGKQ